HLRHESGVSRPYSLAAPAWGPSSTVRFHVRYIAGGEMSELLAGTKPGERFEIEGPFGKCYYRSKTGEEPIVLIGSGTGLAPLYGILTDALFKGHTGLIHLYHGAATSSRLYFRKELAEVARANPNVRYVPTAEAYVESGDRVGSPLKWALSEHPDMEGSRVYLCGHPELVRIGQKQCFLAGANLADISADPFVPA
ncbi:MAG: FAD-binding oxidoreductase, partial [Fimbriimonas sp.]|nr:FAD-binding oxidoreductase [Fimbriimonas sp.]